MALAASMSPVGFSRTSTTRRRVVARVSHRAVSPEAVHVNGHWDLQESERESVQARLLKKEKTEPSEWDGRLPLSDVGRRGLRWG